MKKLVLTISVLGLLAGCEKKEEKTVVSSNDTSTVAVVAAEIKPVAWSDWVTYSSELRGSDDAVLVTSASGTVRSVASVGQVVKAGQALCDIESDRYKVQLDAAKAALDAIQTQLDITRKNVEAGSVGKVALEGLNAQVLGSQSQYLGAKKVYEESRCQAPFAGVVASKLVNQWQAVGPGTPMLRLVRLDRLEATFSVPEVESHDLKNGQAAEFFLLDQPSRVVRGTVNSVDLAADTRNRVVNAKLAFANPGNSFKPGQIGRARILRSKSEKAVVVPSASLLRKEKGVFAMVVVGGKAHEVLVELGSANGDSVLVSSGLKAGDKLIVQGAFRVTEGSRVKE
jgi:membrane fusion protein, multidrug efflux system